MKALEVLIDCAIKCHPAALSLVLKMSLAVEVGYVSTALELLLWNYNLY